MTATLCVNHMCRLDLPVPAAFVVTTDECLRHLYRDDLDPALAEEIRAAVRPGGAGRAPSAARGGRCWSPCAPGRRRACGG